MKTLAIDVGGTGLKAALLDQDGALLGERVRVATPYPCPPAALIEALAAKHILAAAIDVFEQEPTPADNPLLGFDNVIVAPHAVCHTDECMRLLGESAFTSAVDLANGRRPRHVVNSEALGHPSWGGKWHK